MTLRETLLAVRAIVVDANPDSCKCGCLEDAICRVETGKSWFEQGTRNAAATAAEQALEFVGTNYRIHELRELPVYKALQAAATQQSGFGYRHLYSWSDANTKDARLKLLDDVINLL